MCDQVVQGAIKTVVAELVLDQQPFDTVLVRNLTRSRLGTGTPLSYDETHREVLYMWRKGDFRGYLARQRDVLVGTKNQTVIEYVPEVNTVLKKVLANWAKQVPTIPDQPTP